MKKWQEDLIVFIAEKDLFWTISWNKGLKFYIRCNDCFCYGSDAEEITEESFPELKRAIDDVEKASTSSIEEDGTLLYCCRQRKTKPFQYIIDGRENTAPISDELKPLFDEEGWDVPKEEKNE